MKTLLKGLALGGFFTLLAVVGLRDARAGVAEIGARKGKSATIVYPSEGDSLVPYNVTCASTTWTVLRSSEPLSRALSIQASNWNTDTVCVSTDTTSGRTCAQSAPGHELVPGDSIEYKGTSALRCRAAASATNVLKGMRSIHTQD